MNKSTKRKSEVLGMNYSTAYNRLRKMMLWKFIVMANANVCYRCGKEISSIDSLSIEHKDSWLASNDPLEAFFDLENVALSHLHCNCGFACEELKAKGEKNGNSRLKESEVLIIKTNEENKTIKEMAKIYDVGEVTIWDILNEKTWAWLK